MNEKQLEKFLQKTEMNIQSANATFIACCLVFGAYVESHRITGVKFSPIFSSNFYLKKRDFSFYQFIPKQFIVNIAERLYQNYLKDHKTLNKTIENHLELTDKLIDIWQQYKKRKQEISRSELLEIFKKFLKTAKEWWFYGVMMEDKGEIINTKLVPKFAKKHGMDLSKAREVFNILSHPEERTTFALERKEFYDLCLQILNSKILKHYLDAKKYERLLEHEVLKQKIEDYVNRNFWMKTDYTKARLVTPPSVLKEIADELTKKSKQDIEEELKTSDEIFKKINQQKKKILRTVELTKEDRDDLYFAERIIFWNDQRKRGMMILFHYLFKLITDIGKRYKMGFNEISPYAPEEVLDLLAKGRRVDPQEIRKRIKGTFIIYEKGKTPVLVHGQRAEEFFRLASRVKEKEVKGTVASTGGKKLVRGIVRLVFDPEKDLFHEQEILVTSMTRVEFVPLMRKAKAIITNEGGVACHAAIISRELNIPCIVGTKIATKVLKDGDLVKVDANKGIVKIIK